MDMRTIVVTAFLLYVTPRSVNIRVQLFVDLGHRETLYPFGKLIHIELSRLPDGLIISTCLVNGDIGIPGNVRTCPTPISVYVV